jgi:hypothetical protein
VKANQAQFSVATMCRALELSTSGFYVARSAQVCARERQ